MTYIAGNYKTSSNFNVQVKRPLDNRMVSDTPPSDYSYNGMLYYDTSERKLFVNASGSWQDICSGGLQYDDFLRVIEIENLYINITSSLERLLLLNTNVETLDNSFTDLSNVMYSLFNFASETSALIDVSKGIYETDISNKIIEMSNLSLEIDDKIVEFENSMNDFFTEFSLPQETIIDTEKLKRPDYYTKTKYRVGTIPSGTDISYLTTFTAKELLSKIFYGEEYPIIIKPTLHVQNATAENLFYYEPNENINDIIRVIAVLGEGSIELKSILDLISRKMVLLTYLQKIYMLKYI